MTQLAEPVPVVLESPFGGAVSRNLSYLCACLRDSLLRGESPFASHALFTLPGVLRDEVLLDREAGIRAGFVWRQFAKLTVFYVDLGWSSGMSRALTVCIDEGLPYEQRKLGEGWLERHKEEVQAGKAAGDWIESIRSGMEVQPRERT